MAEPAQKFLIIRLSSIGDIVHALPAVSALGEAIPNAEIHWVVEARHARLLDGNRFIHRVIPLDTLGWRNNLSSRATLSAIRRAIGDLLEGHYNSAIDFQGLYKSALIARMSRAKERVGFAAPRLREPAAGVFYTRQISARGYKHVIDLNLSLIEHLGVTHPSQVKWQFPLPSSREADDYVARELAVRGTKEFIIINPGGGWQSKCWLPENYANLIRELEPGFRGSFLLTGSPGEQPLIERIVRESGSTRAGYIPSNLLEFISLARRARLLVGGDTGPLHLTTAVRTPVVTIYGPTDPARNGPFSPDDITLWNGGPIDYTRRAAGAGYISGISMESVARAIRQRLARANG